MGVELTLWRAKIGQFVQPRRTRSHTRTLCIQRRSVSLLLRLFVFLSLTVCGDVEANPGPRSQVSAPPSTVRSTRQASLSFAQQNRSSGNEHRTPDANESQTHEDMFCFLRNMKRDLASQNEAVMKDLSSVNSKIDSITSSINDLKTENEQLKQSNTSLREEVRSLYIKLDSLEAHSRRNNLRISGLSGSETETWEHTEQIVREFISKELNMPEKGEVEIERAHRIKSGGKNSTVIVKFSKFKDCQSILQRAGEKLDKNSDYTVQQDYTERVRRHRRELGKEMVTARENGHYASVRYDKLIIDNKVYRYNDATGSIDCVGDRARRQRGPRASQPRAQTSGEGASPSSARERTPGVTYAGVVSGQTNGGDAAADDPGDVTR